MTDDPLMTSRPRVGSSRRQTQTQVAVAQSRAHLVWRTLSVLGIALEWP
jgi:hypothetical protein